MEVKVKFQTLLFSAVDEMSVQLDDSALLPMERALCTHLIGGRMALRASLHMVVQIKYLQLRELKW